MDIVNEVMNNKEMYLGLALEYGGKAIGFIAIIWIAGIIARMVSRGISTGLQKSKVDLTLSLAIGNLARWGILIAAVVTALGVFGIPTASFAAILAAAGFAVGMALQGSLSNFASGVLLLIFAPFKVGDYVTVAGQSGTVQSIDLFTTAINTVDNKRIVVPNSSIFGNVIENYSFNDFRRVDVAVGVSYDADIDKTRAVLNDVVKSVNGLLDKDHAVVLTNLGDSSVDWAIRCYCKTSDYWPVHQQIVEQTKKQLDKAGIGIPYPHQEVYVHNVNS